MIASSHPDLIPRVVLLILRDVFDLEVIDLRRLLSFYYIHREKPNYLHMIKPICTRAGD